MTEPLSLREFQRAARRALPPATYGYFAGGAGDERTMRDNLAAFRRWHLRPRFLVDVSTPATATSVLGTQIALPVLAAPVGFQRLAHPEGERAAVRATAEAGTVYCLPTLSSVTPEECAAAAPEARRWFQLYWPSDRGFTHELLQRVAGAGYSALVLTIDLPVLGRRERDVRLQFALPDDLPLPNLPPGLHAVGAPRIGLAGLVDPTLTWRDLEWLRGITALPLVVKGVLTSEDALLALEHGAAAVVVSNHGGRQLDGVAASLDVLEEVVEAVGGRAEVLLDGGVRRGIDVLKALALGARAVLVGRPLAFALAAGGEEGVRRAFELLRAEVELGLQLLGCRTPGEVTRGHVAPAR